MKKLIALLLAFTMLLSVGSALAEVTLADALGEIDGDVYKNEYLGIGFVLPSDGNWTYYSQNEIALLNAIAQVLLEDDLKEAMAQAQSITVMYASEQKTASIPSVNIEIMDLGDMAAMVQLVGLERIFASQLDSMKVSLENSGMQNVELRLGALEVDGREETCLWIRYDHVGITIYNTKLCLLRESYLVYVTAISVEEGAGDALLQNVFWID